MQSPIKMMPFDKVLLSKRLERASKRGYDNFLLRKLQDDLEERIYFADANSQNRIDLSLLTDEIPVFSKQFDLITSLLSLQFINNIQGFLGSCHKALFPNGFFIAGFVGGESLKELHHCLAEAELEVTGGVTPHILPFIDVKTAGSLLQHVGFSLPVVDSDKFTVRYNQPIDLLNDLHRSGMSNIVTSRSRLFLRREVLNKALSLYGERFRDEDGRVRATLEILWVSGRATGVAQSKKE